MYPEPVGEFMEFQTLHPYSKPYCFFFSTFSGRNLSVAASAFLLVRAKTRSPFSMIYLRCHRSSRVSAKTDISPSFPAGPFSLPSY
jgi:hypothetical protein